MKNFVIGSGVVAALVFGCGKSSSSNEPTAQGGVSSGRGGRSAGGDAGEGVAPNGGTAAKGGNTATGGAAQSGGSSSAGKGGKGGAPSMAGAANGGDVSAGTSSSSGGADEPGGATGAGGTAATGGKSSAGGTPSSAGAGACDDCGALEQCWEETLCVSKSVSLAAGFSIDATEVTRGQYLAWLATEPSSDDQREACAWNASFAPDPTCMGGDSVCKGSGCDQHPQPCVDFCDAAAYCEAIDKHLCGGIGGLMLDGASNDPDKSQWQHACTSGGEYEFVYGDAISSGKCNDATAGSSTTREVGSKSDCQSPNADFDGVFDLMGNLWEWEDNCSDSAGESDVCNPRGGAFGMSAALPQCTQELPAPRRQRSDNIGFRCCGG